MSSELTEIVTVVFEITKGIDIHEMLCKAIHEQDLGALNVLTDNIADIAIKE